MVSSSRRALEKTNGKRPRRPRQFYGEALGIVVARWMNEKRGSAAYKRIDAIIAEIQETTAFVLELQRKYGYVPGASNPGTAEGCQERQKLEEMTDKLNQRLRFYVGGSPRMHMVDEVGAGLFMLYAPDKSKARPDEWLQLQQVMRLSSTASLHRIRQCDAPNGNKVCGLWFYARFDHQTAHDERCRMKKYRSTERVKERNREKQREYYLLRKNHPNVL